MIQLRFVEHPGIFNWACKKAQGGFPFTHVDAVMPDGKYLGARLLGGVKEREVSEDIGQFIQQKFVDIPASDNQTDMFYAFVRDQCGKGYDPIEIIYFFSGLNLHDPGAWVCCDLIADALVRCGKVAQHMADEWRRITVQGLFLLVSPMVEAG